MPHHSDRLSKSWSFISEDSFSASVPPTDLPLDALEWQPLDNGVAFSEMLVSDLDSEDSSPRRPNAGSSADEQQLQQQPPILERSRVATHRSSDAKRKRTVTFEATWVDSEIPVVGRSSSAPPSIQLLQERIDPNDRRRATTAPPNVFNHMLYGSLRTGPAVDLFSKEFCGLAFSAAATGFMIPFLQNCFHPLLCVYLSYSESQTDATFRFLTLPGVASVLIGAVSDFYPLWSFHRKSYMLGGWILAYFMLMAMVVIAVIDDQSGLLGSNVRTFHGGVVYVLLMMAVSLGVYVASVASFAFLVELSQREPIHERGNLVLQYMVTQQLSVLVADVISSQLMSYDEQDNRTKSLLSMKLLILVMAIVTLVPIPAVLFKLDEEPRQMKVDAVDRSSMRHQLWNVLQQEAVWHIILFICCSVFLASFEFDFVTDAVKYWAGVSPDASRLGLIPLQAVLVGFLFIYKRSLLNFNWIHLTIAGLLWNVALQLVAQIPVIYGGARSPWYLLTMESFAGVAQAITLIVTTLPLVEITENCLEGTTTGLASSFNVIITSVIVTFSHAVSSSSDALERDFSDAVLEQDASSTRTQVLMFALANCAVNLFALIPIFYLLPRQKLDAQQMRTYGNYSRPAGIAIATLLVVLVAYSATMNIWALVSR